MRLLIITTVLLGSVVQYAKGEVHRRAVAFFNPVSGGGSMLDNGKSPIISIILHYYLTTSSWKWRRRAIERMPSVIISGLSSAAVLTNNGILTYARAIGFSSECLGIHIGDPQSADLGDGHGSVNQTMELRQDYGDPDAGTCLESLIGGNHFRVFRQDGPTANSGALFLAVSQEEPATKNHDIVPDGYNIGRDKLVAGAIGDSSFDGVKYHTTAENLTGLLAPGADGINHGIAQDGITALLTVTIL
ncbi:hypothetical protein AMATHDRAFT_2470 [Amanita thiersii Skay4041]|uniref:Uncharacterized protein n=1 Tax=Amanita thiersii Skay4041 TaxID=703135 RepID=A0A2A9NUK2_9AGAR|nr:hypothetical protein AMATHDRAFT_2470 [Amanita thiersii Skay4041]